MANELDPIIGNWYRHLDKGQMFRVVAIDQNDGHIEVQHFDGDIEDVELVRWRSMNLEIAAAPEDWTGPMDDIENDDLGYTETDMSAQDWRRPLEETPREKTEAWEDSRPEKTGRQKATTPPDEELWEPAKIEDTVPDCDT